MLDRFGKLIRDIRITRRLLLYDMAKELDISTAELSAIETGKKPVPDWFIPALEKSYGIGGTCAEMLRFLAKNRGNDISLERMKKVSSTINLVLKIPAEQIDTYNRLMAAEKLDYEKNDIQRFSTVNSWTVNAGEGYEIDVKICSSNDGDPLWCEAVLFLNGCEQVCSDVEDQLDGEWNLEANDISFILTVERGD